MLLVQSDLVNPSSRELAKKFDLSYDTGNNMKF